MPQELEKARALLIEKDTVIGRMTLEHANIKDELTAMQNERDVLLSRVSSLQKSLLDRERDEPRRLDQAVAPFRFRMDELTQEVQMQKMAIDQKNTSVDEANKARVLVQKEMDQVKGEKMVLREEMRKIADQLDGMKTLFENKSADERASFQEKIKDLQSRLSAEQMLTGEKIKQAEKPLKARLILLEACSAESKGKDLQMTALTKEKEDLSVRLRTAEAKNTELSAQLLELKKSIELLKHNAK